MRKVLLTIVATLALSILSTGCGPSEKEIRKNKMKEMYKSTSMRARLSGIKSSCDAFYSEYNQYPKSLEDLKGIENIQVNTRKIKFYTGSIDDEWTSVEGDVIGIMIDTTSDGIADTCLKGTASNKNNISIPKNIPIVVFTGKGGSDNKILSTLDW